MPRSLVLLPILLFAALALGGCSVDDAILRAEHAVAVAQAATDKATAGLAQAEQAVTVAKATLAEAQAVASATGSDAAKDAVAKAADAVRIAEAAIPTVRQTAADTTEALAAAKSSLDAAKAAKAAGGSTWDVLIAIASTAIPAAGAIGKLIADANKLRTAVAVTANHADRVEAANTDEDVDKVKAISRAEQVAHGVVDIIAAARGKTS